MSVNKPLSQEEKIQKLRESYGKNKAQREKEYNQNYNHIEVEALRKHLQDKSLSLKSVNQMNARHQKEHDDKETTMNIRLGRAVEANVHEIQSRMDEQERQSRLNRHAGELLELRDSKYSAARKFDIASTPPPANKDGKSFEK